MLDKIDMKYIPYVILAVMYMLVNPMRNMLGRDTWYLVVGLAYLSIFVINAGVLDMIKGQKKYE